MERIDSVVQALQSLQVTGLEPESPEDTAQVSSVSLTAESGTFELTLLKDDQNYLVKRDDVPGLFAINESVFEKLSPLGDLQSLFINEDKLSDEETSKADTATEDNPPETAQPGVELSEGEPSEAVEVDSTKEAGKSEAEPATE